jgi:hypothetical protein
MSNANAHPCPAYFLSAFSNSMLFFFLALIRRCARRLEPASFAAHAKSTKEEKNTTDAKQQHEETFRHRQLTEWITQDLGSVVSLRPVSISLFSAVDAVACARHVFVRALPLFRATTVVMPTSQPCTPYFFRTNMLPQAFATKS